MIEDNVLGSTILSKDELEGLLIPLITTRAQLNQVERDAILLARRQIFSSRKFRKNLITISELCRLHKDIFGPVWSWAGKLRVTEKNIGINPIHISTQLHLLCENIQYQIENDLYEWKDLAAMFHHRLVQIHPFVNGNGRHARFATDLLARNLKQSFPTWGGKEDQTNFKTRKDYINALRKADQGNISKLLEFMFI